MGIFIIIVLAVVCMALVFRYRVYKMDEPMYSVDFRSSIGYEEVD